MKTPNDKLTTIFIDIDRTIIDDKEVPFPNAVEMIKKLSQKVNIFIWSAGGYDYSMETVNRLGLTEFVCGALPKPNYTIDDLNIDLPFSQNIYPHWNFIETFEKMLVGDYINDIDLLK